MGQPIAAELVADESSGTGRTATSEGPANSKRIIEQTETS
jgi:hypothetical protein